ncbi:unnamed protein product [Peniophora sp. CBMAI 1063]|nr:unnamed protein product [Peniophora sp. CBMAI 1063]
MTSLLRDTLKNAAEESRVQDRPDNAEPASEDSDNELITVESTPGTAAPSRPASRTGMRRPAATSSPLKPLAGATNERRTLDPIRLIPTTVCQRIFSMLDLRSLSRCARVSRKWSKSQTLNYVWFQYYRKETFHDESLPPGKWTKRESKENWRQLYAKDVGKKEPDPWPVRPPRSSGYNSGHASGYVTPRELKEQKWAEENTAVEKLSKVEMRGVYKELGGRKSKSKGKVGATGGARDRGGWAVSERDEGEDSFY